MTTQFILNKTELQKLSVFTSHAKDVLANTKIVCLPDVASKTLTVLIQGADNLYTAKYIISLDSITSDAPEGQLNYFITNLTDVVSNALKIAKGEDTVEILIDNKESTQTIIKSTITNTKIAITNYEKLKESTVQRMLESFNDYQNCFTGDTYTIKPTMEFLNIMTVICRSMRTSGRELNSAMVNRNKIIYCDPQGIMEYTLEEEISPYDTGICVQDSIVKCFSPFIKDDVSITFDSTNRFAKIETSTGLLLITSTAENSFQYPTPEEIDMVGPDMNKCISISVKKSDLLEGFSKFEGGLFRAELWKWENIKLGSSKSVLNNGYVTLYHNDSNAEVSTTVPVTVIANNNEEEDCEFLIGSAYIKDILSQIEDESITISYSSGAIGTPHGTGLTIDSSKLKVVCIKIINPDM